MTEIRWYEDPGIELARDAWNSREVLAITGGGWRRPWMKGVFLDARESVEYARKPRGPWQTAPMGPVLREALCLLHTDMQAVFSEYYSHLGPPSYSQFTFRPTITVKEAHFDKEKGVVITAFVNLDDEDRVWKLGEEEVRFPPGCLWIFRAEKIEHEVVFGKCCAQLNWHLM